MTGISYLGYTILGVQAQLQAPLIRPTTPAHKHMAWYGEWRWYGFAEPFYLCEGFRSHLLSVGVRYTP